MKNIKITVKCVAFDEIESPNRLDTEDSIGWSKEGCSPCIICGRPTRTDDTGLAKKMLGLFQSNKGDYLTDESETWSGLDENDFLGYYPCGSDCFKKYQKMSVNQELTF